MTKVKIFSDESRFALEEAINEWMARQGKTFKVISISFSATVTENITCYNYRYFALVAYEVG